MDQNQELPDSKIAASQFVRKLHESTGINVDPSVLHAFIREHWLDIGPLLLAMSEQAAPKAHPESEKPPHFPSGVLVSGESALVVDSHGAVWWVDPHARSIKRADVR
jgi:hypothetical protein